MYTFLVPTPTPPRRSADLDLQPAFKRPRGKLIHLLDIQFPPLRNGDGDGLTKCADRDSDCELGLPKGKHLPGEAQLLPGPVSGDGNREVAKPPHLPRTLRMKRHQQGSPLQRSANAVGPLMPQRLVLL